MQNFLGRLQSSSFLLKFSSVQLLHLEPVFEKICNTVTWKAWGQSGKNLGHSGLPPSLPPSLPSFLLSLSPSLPTFSFSFFLSFSTWGTFYLSLLRELLSPVFLGSRGNRKAAQRRKGTFRFKRNLVCLSVLESEEI